MAAVLAELTAATRDGVRSGDDLAACLSAFRAIDRDPAHLLLVADADGAVVATMQLSFLPGLARRGCALVQLTTDKSRGAAHRFYERLGFVPSHEGMKLSF
jgi:GNAT superfamily N-acetyltransferase